MHFSAYTDVRADTCVRPTSNAQKGRYPLKCCLGTLNRAFLGYKVRIGQLDRHGPEVGPFQKRTVQRA